MIISLRRAEMAYYIAALLALLICWSPFNALAYVVPFGVIFMLTFLGNGKRLFIRSLIWISLWVLFVSFYALINQDFRFGNALVAFVTWAGVIVLLLIPIHYNLSQQLHRKLERLAWLFLGVESIWGIVQGLYGYIHTGSFDLANGDYVEGTIHPPLQAELAYSNVMFAINIALLLLFLLPLVWRKPRLSKIIFYSLGVIAFVMASVMHVILFLIAAGMIGAFWVWGRRLQVSQMAVMLFLFGFIFSLVTLLLPRNLRTARGFALQVLRGEVPKSVSVIVTIKEMPHKYWYLPLVGLGPGQYASRAGLISTGLYFGGLNNPKTIPFLPNEFTESQYKYLLPLWEWHESVRGFGSTQKPFFSWLAVYTEWGLIGWLFVLGILVLLFRRVGTLPRYYKVEKFALITAIVLFFFLGFQENNWEVPQAWFSGLLLVRVLYVPFQPIIRLKIGR